METKRCPTGGGAGRAREGTSRRAQCCCAGTVLAVRLLACPARALTAPRRQLDDLEEEGTEHREGRDGKADGCVAGDRADLAPAVGVEQHAAKRGALEDGRHFTSELGVGGISLRGGAQLRVGLATTDLVEMDGDEVVGVDLGLRTGGQLLAGVDPSWLRHQPWAGR